MRHSLRILLWGLALCCACTAGAATELRAWGYVGWWLPEGWRSVELHELERVMFFDLQIQSDGSIGERHGWPDQWAELIKATQQSQTPIDVCVTLMDVRNFQQVFNSPPHVQKLQSEILGLLAQEAVSGIHLDVEIYDAVPPKTLEAFRNFVQDIALQVQARSDNKQISVFVPIGGVTALYDGLTLATLNRVVLQGYDAHWKDGQTAGPVAPLDGPGVLTWTKLVALGKGWGIPPERLLLGFPLYGYEWRVKDNRLLSATLGPGTSTTFAPMVPQLVPEFSVSVRERVLRYGASYDAKTASAYYQFRKSDGVRVQGWFDDWWTLLRKSEYLLQEKVGGMAFFLLGYDDGQLLQQFFYQRSLRAR